MKSTVGNIILIGAFIAFSSAAIWRRFLESAACTLRDAAERDAELVGLDDRPAERGDLGRVDAHSELLQRIVAALADAHLAERECELVGERALEVVGELVDRTVEAGPPRR